MKHKQWKYNILNKNLKLQFIVCIVLSSIVIILFLVFNKAIEVKNNRIYTIEENKNLNNRVENLKIEDNNIIVSGYAFMLDIDSTNSLISVFLRSLDKGQEIWLSTEQVARPDVNSYFDCEYDYGNSGFNATIEIDRLDKNVVYEIIVNVDYINNPLENTKTRTTVSTERYIYNNEYYAYNPNEFELPIMDIESDMLREVFSNGHLCLYQKDVGMYVYQYEDNLYWIASKDFNFNEDKSTYILYQIFTSQVERLPKKRVEYKYDSLSFYFEEKEYKEEPTDPYRVVIRNIPNDYPIKYIKTGVYDNVNKEGIWIKYFNLAK